MFSFKRASIRQRLTTIIMAASVVSVLLSSVTISVIGLYGLRNDMADELKVSASIVGDRNAAAILFNDNMMAENNLRVFSVKHAIELACLYDKSGQLFARYGRNDVITTCPPNQTERLQFTADTLEVVHPIEHSSPAGKELIGNIYIRSDLGEIKQYISRQGFIALWVTVAVLLVSYLMAVALQRGISLPVLRLAATAREVAINKDYTVRAHPFDREVAGSHNELALLTEAFNTMLHEIGEREAKLRQQNVELALARDAAESASRAKSQFLANVSHELRTPLNAIIGFSSILMNQLFGPVGDSKYMEYARDINESGVHLLDVINDILDLSRAETGNLELHHEEVHVGKSLLKCVTLLADRAAKNSVLVTTDIPRQLPPIVADRLRFMQIVLNILSNAIKFTGPGGKVHMAVDTQMAGGDVSEFVITIRDTGIGMTKDDIVKAFQSFGQVDGDLNRRYEGTGLGLPLARKLLELHHGHITIESEPGVGTMVTITMPAFPPGGLELNRS